MHKMIRQYIGWEKIFVNNGVNKRFISIIHKQLMKLNTKKQATQSIDREMDKIDVLHIYNGILLIHKKNKKMPFIETCINLEIVILTKVSQTEKEIYDITYMWEQKKRYK